MRLKALDETLGVRTRTFEYDGLENSFVTNYTNELGHESNATYLAGLGIPAWVQDANGLYTHFSYDGFGRLLKQETPGGGVTKPCVL